MNGGFNLLTQKDNNVMKICNSH